MKRTRRRQASSVSEFSAGYESVIPNPNARLLDPVREVMRVKGGRKV